MGKPFKFSSNNSGSKPKRKVFTRRPNEKIEWDYEILHKHVEAKKTATMWGSNGQGNWARMWNQYAGDLLQLAKGQQFSNKKPHPPKCHWDTQQGSPYVRPGHLQCVRI